jgi:ABC-type transport system involved in multi-copper enzyme maturation permease subunit
MFWNIAKFEFNYQRKQPAFYVVAGLYFLMSFMLMASENVRVGGTGGEFDNSPWTIDFILLMLSVFGMFSVTAFVSKITLRDHDFKMAEIIYSTSITKAQYLFGRFIGAFAVAFYSFAFVAFGLLLGSFAPWMDVESMGPFMLYPYFHGLFILALPSLFFSACLFFFVSTITRSIMMTYASAIGFLILFSMAEFITAPELRDVMAMLDPFGDTSFADVTRYWTVFEKNTQTVPIEGIYLLNRILWIGISFALLGMTYAMFKFETAGNAINWFWKKKIVAEADPERRAITAKIPRVTPSFGWKTTLKQFWVRMAFEAGQIRKSPAFYIILGFGIFNSSFALLNLDTFFGTDIYPVTRVMIEFVSGSFSIILMIILTYYTSELVWRDRDVKIHEVIDATPTANWAFVVSKMFSMFLVLFSLVAVSMVTAVLIQTGQGYAHLELGMYFERLFYHFAFPFYLIAVLSIFFQVITNHKYFGMLLMVMFIIAGIVMGGLGFEHNLYQFASRPSAPISDMNGYGHFMEITKWFDIYWAFFSGLLLVLSYLMWNRGAIVKARGRLKQMRVALGPVSVVLMVLASAGFITTGSYIYYNTNVLNEFRSSDEVEMLQVAYENKLSQYQSKPQVRITGVRADVDLFPTTRGFKVKGQYDLENKTDEPLTEVHVSLDPTLKVDNLSIASGEMVMEDRDNNFFIFGLFEALPVGGTLVLDFETSRTVVGFKNSQNNSKVQYNGSFINNFDAMPIIGYSEAFIVTDRKARRKHGLSPIDRAPKLDDMEARKNSYLRSDSDWVTFETTVSTIEGQTAIAPGYLVKDWVEDGRHYFSYKMDKPIQNFFAFLSAEYTVEKDKWNDVDIGIYYHQPHDYNTKRMIDSVKKSLDYFSANFSPYQYRQLRILEFPDYARFAQSFPNTVPYSEGIGFIADVTDEDAIDYVFYVTAHEVAHQWWAHQVMAADVQGGTILVETLAQYSALMVMKKEYGEDHMRRFLKFELDTYLRNRGSEAIGEMPLGLVENQTYIHYNKGSVIMYSLQDYLGEDVVNTALANLIKKQAYQHNPYPVSTDLIDEIRAVAPADKQDLITDMFEKIVLYDLKVDKATVSETDDGKYKVTMTVAAKKFEATGKGEQTDMPIDIAIDIGIFDKDPDEAKLEDDFVLYFQKHRITKALETFEFIVDRKPTRVGIDPYAKLIDRDTSDNLMAVSVEEGVDVVGGN